MRVHAAALALCAVAAAANAHDAPHGTPPLPAAEGLALPLALGGPFTLTDQHGRTRTEADPDGRLQLLFFGYAHCEAICTVALPQMAGIVQDLRAQGIPVRPVMVTVDPDRDTPEVMAEVLEKLDPDFVGLTGAAKALAATYRAFSVENTVVFTDPAGNPVYAHGSLLYLLDGQGRFLTVIPPILSDERAVEIIAAFAPRS
jgi:protein SCO1/2